MPGMERAHPSCTPRQHKTLHERAQDAVTTAMDDISTAIDSLVAVSRALKCLCYDEDGELAKAEKNAYQATWLMQDAQAAVDRWYAPEWTTSAQR
jgi:hypothetical protein